MNRKPLSGMLTLALLTLAALALMSCGSDPAPETGAFAAIPEDVMLLGAVDLQKMLSIPAVAEAISENKATETAQALRDAGLSPESMKSVHFAVSASEGKALAESNLIAIFSTSSELDMEKLILLDCWLTRASSGTS